MGPVMAIVLALIVAAPEGAAEEHRILFVGNSYTFQNGANNVAGCYSAIATEGISSWDPVTQQSVAKGGWTFHKHALDMENEGQELHDLLGEGDEAWDVVVFQEQSQIPGFHPYDAPDWDQSIAAAPTLDLSAAAAGAETVFLMTWGRRDGDPMNAVIFPDYPTMQALLTEGYELYAAEASTPERQAWVAPVGLAWKAVRDATIEAGLDPLDSETLFYRLYSGDGSHPSQLGSYLMGMVVYASLTGRDPAGLLWVPDGTSVEDRTALQSATRRAVLEPPFETVDYGWGPLHRLPWLHTWEAIAGDAGPVTLFHPIRRDTVVIDRPASAPSIVLGGADGAQGRIVLQGEAALTVDEISLGAGGEGAVDVQSGTFTATTVEVPVSLSGGGWILPAVSGGATLAGDLTLDAGATLRFDLGSLPDEDATNASLKVEGTATLAGRIFVVAAEDLLLPDTFTTWTLVDATTIDAKDTLTLSGPEFATMDIVDGGLGQILQVTLPANTSPLPEPTPDVVTGEDVVTAENVAEVLVEDIAAAPDATPDTVAEPTPPSGRSEGGGCGVGMGGVGTWWWLLLVLLGVVRPRITFV